MNRLLIKFSLIVLFASCLLPLSAQDPMYSQFTHNPIYYNAAYTGISEGLRVRTSIRKQWPNLPGEYRSTNFNMDFASRGIPGAGGIGLMFDKHTAGSGYYERTKIGIPVSVRIPLYENLLVQLGVMPAIVQKKLDWSKLVFVDQLDPRFGNIYPTAFTAPTDSKITYPDVDLGLLFRWVGYGYGGKEYVVTTGFAVHHVFSPNESFYDSQEANLPRKFVITIDAIIQNEVRGRGFNSRTNTHKDFKINPGFIFEKQQDFRTFSIGLNVYKSSMYAGFWYRNDDFDFAQSNSLVVMAGISAALNEETRVKIMYSYDMLLNESYARSAGGTHEISLIFELDSFIPFSGGGANTPGRRNIIRGLECSPF